MVRVEGRVQGVCFRHYTRETAIQLGITGWARNCSNGSVETLIHGSDEAVKRMIAWLGHGPSSAIVSQVHLNPVEADPLPSGFKITY